MCKGSTPFCLLKTFMQNLKGRKNSCPRQLSSPPKNWSVPNDHHTECHPTVTCLTIKVINKSLFKPPMHHCASSAEPSKLSIIENHSSPCQLSPKETVNMDIFLGILKLSVHHIFFEFLLDRSVNNRKKHH